MEKWKWKWLHTSNHWQQWSECATSMQRGLRSSLMMSLRLLQFSKWLMILKCLLSSAYNGANSHAVIISLWTGTCSEKTPPHLYIKHRNCTRTKYNGCDMIITEAADHAHTYYMQMQKCWPHNWSWPTMSSGSIYNELWLHHTRHQMWHICKCVECDINICNILRPQRACLQITCMQCKLKNRAISHRRRLPMIDVDWWTLKHQPTSPGCGFKHDEILRGNYIHPGQLHTTASVGPCYLLDSVDWSSVNASLEFATK